MCDGKDPNQKKRRLSLKDFADPRKPWDLRDYLQDDSIEKAFKFLPERFKEGPWKPLVTLTIVIIICLIAYLTIDANIKYYVSDGNTALMKEFVGDKSYPAFTMEWFYNVSLFFWMSFVNWAIYSTYSSFGPWVSFTMCSWTIMCIRHGLCSLAPFLPSLRLLIGILRFPVLLSASVTFGVWNFVLMPVISLVFLKGERRTGFLKYMFGWTLCQIHIFNIVYAYLNCIWAEPIKQGLHLGDVNAGVVYIIAYILFYYFILDRIGVQLYAIFSPRTYIAIPALVMTIGICVGNYFLWDKILAVTK